MLAFLSVWIGLGTLALAAGMFLHRPLFTDVAVVLVLWVGAPGAMCLAGLVLWAYRKDTSHDAGVSGQRMQAKIAMAMAGGAAAIVYLLIIYSHKLNDDTESSSYARTPRIALADVGGGSAWGRLESA